MLRLWLPKLYKNEMQLADPYWTVTLLFQLVPYPAELYISSLITYHWHWPVGLYSKQTKRTENYHFIYSGLFGSYPHVQFWSLKHALHCQRTHHQKQHEPHLFPTVYVPFFTPCSESDHLKSQLPRKVKNIFFNKTPRKERVHFILPLEVSWPFHFTPLTFTKSYHFAMSISRGPCWWF